MELERNLISIRIIDHWDTFEVGEDGSLRQVDPEPGDVVTVIDG